MWCKFKLWKKHRLNNTQSELIASSFKENCKKQVEIPVFLYFYYIKTYFFILKIYIFRDVRDDFNRFFDALSRETIKIVKFHVVLKIHAKKHLEIHDFCFITKIKSYFFIWKLYIFGNIIDTSNIFFDVLSREKIRMGKFSVV